ncbi:MAG: hypothetical protein ABIK36_19575 [Pseudomonadota bacterium]
MAEKRTETPIHSVTLQFAGPLAEQMANHFFTDWLDGGLDQIWEERLDDADVAESISYDWDMATRTLVITAVAEDGDEDEEEAGKDADVEADEDDDKDSEAAAEIEGNHAKEDA